MEKPHDTDDIAMLSSRFHALVDKVQGLIDELAPHSRSESDGTPRLESGQKTYMVQASQTHDEKRHRALLKVIDDVLTQIDRAVCDEIDTPPGVEPGRCAFFRNKKKLFTVEELNFLEKTLQTFHTTPLQDYRPER